MGGTFVLHSTVISSSKWCGSFNISLPHYKQINFIFHLLSFILVDAHDSIDGRTLHYTSVERFLLLNLFVFSFKCHTETNQFILIL